ncbi:amino acid permease [Longimonas halophila]|uniref:Amino acid permease n=1 Tax=Longimonas halophila TaxID=1469170 RepID=A0A2H3P3X7_9BACT|nr:APC family permease [Longimonas halophila]PEN06219.1 amino acid permease [Longimonas halophila]
MASSNDTPRLVRAIGVPGAVLLGLGSMVGTGVFVSIGIAAGIAGPAVMLAIAIAACVAACNAFSSAQLAANHPVSGGTYEYGYEYLGARFGFTAGWMYLAAKSASAATAALGFAGYLLGALGGPASWIVPVALGAVVVLTGIVLSGIRRSNWTNMAIVSVTLATLAYFVLGGLTTTVSADGAAQFFDPFFAPAAGEGPFASLLHASALMFVAFTGYGRIATLGEEVQRPKRTIPRAIVVTMIVVTVLYIGVAATGVAAIGADGLGAATDAASPLEAAIQALALPGGTAVITIGACTAMLGVLLNLLLGLSRVLLAMGRRGDMPEATTRLNAARTTPTVAVLTIGALIFGLALIGDVRTTWTFSAFTVLIYYALTNLSALQLSPEHRLYPRAVAWGGLVGCLGLAFWVEPAVWATGLALIAVGLIWHAVAQR